MIRSRHTAIVFIRKYDDIAMASTTNNATVQYTGMLYILTRKSINRIDKMIFMSERFS